MIGYVTEKWSFLNVKVSWGTENRLNSSWRNLISVSVFLIRFYQPLQTPEERKLCGSSLLSLNKSTRQFIDSQLKSFILLRAEHVLIELKVLPSSLQVSSLPGDTGSLLLSVGTAAKTHICSFTPYFWILILI